MYYTSPVSNISPALVSVAMSRSDSRDSQVSMSSFTSAPMHVTYSTSPSTYKSNSSMQTSSTRTHRDSLSSGWLPSPYRSCMQHSSSSQGYETSSTSSYISDDDLLALDEISLPIERIANITSAPRMEQPKRELTTEEHIAMLREMQEREQAANQYQRKPQPPRTVRFASDSRKPRRPSGVSQKRNVVAKR